MVHTRNVYSTFTHVQDEKSVIIDMIMAQKENEAKMKNEEKRTSERVKAKKARTRPKREKKPVEEACSNMPTTKKLDGADQIRTRWSNRWSPRRSQSQPSTTKKLGGGWTEITPDDGSDPYFWHGADNKTQWERPASAAPPAAKPQEAKQGVPESDSESDSESEAKVAAAATMIGLRSSKKKKTPGVQTTRPKAKRARK